MIEIAGKFLLIVKCLGADKTTQDIIWQARMKLNAHEDMINAHNNK